MKDKLIKKLLKQESKGIFQELDGSERVVCFSCNGTGKVKDDSINYTIEGDDVMKICETCCGNGLLKREIKIRYSKVEVPMK